LATPATDKARQKLNQSLFYMSIDSIENKSQTVKNKQNRRDPIKKEINRKKSPRKIKS